MDLRTRKLYDSVEEARADGVPESDIARVEAEIDARGLVKLLPEVSFAEMQEARRRKAVASGSTWRPAK